MPRRAPLLLLAFVGLLLAVWLARSARREAAPSVSAEVTEDEHAARLEAATGPELASPREAVAPTTTSGVDGDRSPDAASARLVVLAVDAIGGAPLPGVRVAVSRPPPASSSSSAVEGSSGTLDTSPLTGPDGRAEFELPADTAFQLFAHGSGGVGSEAMDLAPFTRGERRELRIELPVRHEVAYFGRVLSAEDRRPVAGASVRVVSATWSSLREPGESREDEIVQARAESDADGRFELEVRPWERPDIRVDAAGFAPVFLEVGSEHDTPTLAKVVLLARDASLRVRLFDATGASVPDAAVLLWTENYYLGQSDHGSIYQPSLPAPQWASLTDPSGTCVLEGLPPDVPLHVEVSLDGEAKKDLPAVVPGLYTLVAHGWKHADSEPAVAHGGDQDVVLRLTAAGSASGTVRDGTTGKACAAALTYGRTEVARSFGLTDTGDDGTFRLEGLAPGTYDLAARASGGRVGVLRGVSVSAGGEVSDLVLSLEPGARLRVRYAGTHGFAQVRVIGSGVTITGDGIPAGGSAESVVPSGVLVVEGTWSGKTERIELELGVGEEQEIVFGEQR